jgi:hypothetical protein
MTQVFQVLRYSYDRKGGLDETQVFLGSTIENVLAEIREYESYFECRANDLSLLVENTPLEIKDSKCMCHTVYDLTHRTYL